MLAFVNLSVVDLSNFYVLISIYFHQGFELAVRTSVAPESILIGVPSSADLFNANFSSSGTDHGSNERTFELTFAVCNSSLMDCNPATSYYTVDNTGGTDLLLDFISEIVIPTVLRAIGNFTKGEVSIAGASLGGLTAIYAVAARPDTYSRAFSLEGTTPYNFGQVADVVTNTYATTGLRPKAVVMMLGTSVYAVFTNPTTNQIQNELDLTMRADRAFQVNFTVCSISESKYFEFQIFGNI